MTDAERRLLLILAASVNMLAQRQGLHTDIVQALSPAINAVADEMVVSIPEKTE